MRWFIAWRKPLSLDSPEDVKRKCAERKAMREAGRVGKGNSPGKKKSPGRPKGGNALVAKLNDLAEDGHYDKLLSTLEAVANDPEHKQWGFAMKLLMERAAHVSHFEKDRLNQGHNAININISTVGEKPVEGVTVDHGES